jgi:hypothetical protein
MPGEMDEVRDAIDEAVRPASPSLDVMTYRAGLAAGAASRALAAWEALAARNEFRFGAPDVWHRHVLTAAEIWCGDPACPCVAAASEPGRGHARRISGGDFTLDRLAEALARHRREHPRG